jgi:3-hydroxyisobutyrate dehydrogenase-like beta-hydroxyacid dehydrogenase
MRRSGACVILPGKTEAAMQIGFLGLGQMGSAIAERLESADVTLHVFDPNATAMAPFVTRGATGHASPRAVADQAEIVFACLPDAITSLEVAREVVRGNAVRTYVEMSTIGTPAMRQIAVLLAERSIGLVDCPVSGGPRGARAGTLTVIAAGDPGAVQSVKPLLQQIGKNVFIAGAQPGHGQLMKLVNNLMNAANMAIAFEALVLGAKGGLDPRLMVDIINVSTGRNSATMDKVPRAVLTGSFDYGAKLKTMVKDVVLGLEEAENLDVPMWVHETVGQLWRFGMITGRAEKDFTSLIQVIEDWAGVQVRGHKPSA